MKTRRGLSAGLAVLALTGATLAGCTRPGGGGGPTTTDPGTPTTEPGPGGGTGNQKGPDPTDASISAARGPFAISQFTVARGNGFGGGTVYYPTAAGRYGGVAVVPGFASAQSSIQWYGPRVASQGFVVITIDTNTTGDQPASRGQQQNAALRLLTSDSRVKDKVDPSRLAAMGWSMGGGGSLEAARTNANIKAVVPLAPWNTNASWGSLRTPTLIVQCGSDTIAPNAQHSNRFYSSLGSSEKAIFQIPGSHFCVTTANTAIAKMAISWLKRFVDDDTRYSTLICQGPGAGASNFRSTCPV
jgi:dienelactone hydrolase